MKKILVALTILLDETWKLEDPQEKKWFFEEILTANKGELYLHSNEIGDTIGKVIGSNVIEIID